jgi:hypothetical protein
VLEANDLRTLLDALRPPPGHQLDRAMGTTFSLDLYALVTAPLAFALFDSESSEDDAGIAELLESIRRHAESIDIFCQAGQIGLPVRYRPIVAYLETSVHPVTPTRRGQVFHPKLWALRFTAAGEPPLYRLIVLSRKLTFDRSYDTLLVLDGQRDRGREVRERNAPLSRFLRHLPRLAITPLTRERRESVEQLARDFETVDFTLPAGFDAVHFWPIGLGRSARVPFLSAPRGGRKLIVSPFLSPALLARLGSGGVLVSRAESLDTIGADDLAAFDEIHVLSDAACDPDVAEDPSASSDENVAEAAGAPLRGLHAKLFAFDAGRHAHLFTGSANATSAAFAGNVEFLAELVGSRKRCGVDAILTGNGGTGFGELLEPYDPAAASPRKAESPLALQLDELRREIATRQFTCELDPDAESGYLVTLRASGEDPLPQESSSRCWPITLRAASALPLTRAWADGAVFPLSVEGITAFFAVELALNEEGRREKVEFVVRATLVGAPTDRLDRLLVQMLKSRGDVLRYMLFLLAGDDTALAALRGLPDDVTTGTSGHDDAAVELPLLEWMVRALARSPERIDHLGRLIVSLKATDEGRMLLPDGLDAVWDAIWEARAARR